MPTMIIDQDCVILTILVPPTQQKHNKLHNDPVEPMPTMIIDQDCVILTILVPPTPLKQRGYLIRQKMFFNPNKNDQ